MSTYTMANILLYMYVLQVTWGNKGATEEGSKLTKAKVRVCDKIMHSVIVISIS